MIDVIMGLGPVVVMATVFVMLWLRARKHRSAREFAVNPFYGTIEPRPSLSGARHDPSPTGIFDRGGIR